MKNWRKIGIAATAAMLMGALSTGFAVDTYAWGPERTTYTNEAPATAATFNSITNNAAVGDERDFVRIAEKKAGEVYKNSVNVEPGKQYEVYIYYHNNASETYNTSKYNYAGVAYGTRLATSFPTKLAAGEKGMVSGTISADNTVPKKVWDEAYVTATQAVTLHYVTGSAKIYNDWGVNGSVLSDTQLFSETGTLLGLNELNGMILGCDEFSGQVVYTIQVEAVDGGMGAAEPEKPAEPALPRELPTTGPVEIALAAVIVIIVIAGVVYWQRTRRIVKKTRRAAVKATGKVVKPTKKRKK